MSGGFVVELPWQEALQLGTNCMDEQMRKGVLTLC